jgi:cation diffusion facilitator family transporter
VAEDQGIKAILAALVANVGIAVSKFVAFLFTGSSAMLAEAVHSFADSSNQILLLIGGRRAARPATDQHQFGYGRSRFLYAFIVAIVIFLAGGVFALYEAYEKFAEPHPLEEPIWAFAVLIISIGLEGFSLRTAVKESSERRGALSWPQFVKRTKAPELIVVLLEDFGALIGLVLALFGITMAVVTGNGRWDAVGTVGIGVLLVMIAAVLATQTSSLLLGEAADPAMVERIERALADPAHVQSVIHMRTVHLSPDELLVTAKIEVPETATAKEIIEAINLAEEKIRDAVPYRCLIYLEPDLRH